MELLAGEGGGTQINVFVGGGHGPGGDVSTDDVLRYRHPGTAIGAASLDALALKRSTDLTRSVEVTATFILIGSNDGTNKIGSLSHRLLDHATTVGKLKAAGNKIDVNGGDVVPCSDLINLRLEVALSHKERSGAIAGELEVAHTGENDHGVLLQITLHNLLVVGFGKTSDARKTIHLTTDSERGDGEVKSRPQVLALDVATSKNYTSSIGCLATSDVILNHDGTKGMAAEENWGVLREPAILQHLKRLGHDRVYLKRLSNISSEAGESDPELQVSRFLEGVEERCIAATRDLSTLNVDECNIRTVCLSTRLNNESIAGTADRCQQHQCESRKGVSASHYG
eukprot:Colp12_sorted_trinity150504_noHs@7145